MCNGDKSSTEDTMVSFTKEVVLFDGVVDEAIPGWNELALAVLDSVVSRRIGVAGVTLSVSPSIAFWVCLGLCVSGTVS